METRSQEIRSVTDPGASEYFTALKLGADDTVGLDEVMKVITYLSTDGENKNFGEHHDSGSSWVTSEGN